MVGLPLRQTADLVASLLEMAGLDWPVPDYSTLCRRQARIAVQIPYRRSGTPLNLRIDSTGVKFRGDGEWPVRKHGPLRRGQWRKVHIGADTGAGEVRGVEFTSSRQGDSPLLPEWLMQIPRGRRDRHCHRGWRLDTWRCHAAIIERGADAVIPIRRSGRAWKEDCPAALAFVLGPMADIGAPRNETLRATRHLGRAFRRWTGDHARSRAEARMNCLKAFGERIMSRDPDRQTAEIQIRIIRNFRSDQWRDMAHS